MLGNTAVWPPHSAPQGHGGTLISLVRGVAVTRTGPVAVYVTGIQSIVGVEMAGGVMV